MSRIVTIDCTPNEIRIAVGSKGLTGVSLEHVVCCPLVLGENEELISSPKTLDAIQSLLKKVGVKSGEAVVCVGRSSIELRALTLPSVDNNELPDMVRFAAQRHFANVGDNWPIDFVTMPSSHENMTECLAASMNPVLIERVHKVLESCGLTLTQLVLRPMASATMAVVKQPQLATSVVLLLDLFRDEADMAVTENGHVVFMRNVRFSGSNNSASNLQILTGEIKRTMIAAASQRPDLNVEQIRIWGDDSQHAELCRSLSQSLSVPVTSLDPLQLFDASQSVRSEADGDAGKFAASVGALMAPQLADRLIDFSNPAQAGREDETRRHVRTRRDRCRSPNGRWIRLVLAESFDARHTYRTTQCRDQDERRDDQRDLQESSRRLGQSRKVPPNGPSVVGRTRVPFDPNRRIGHGHF